MRKKLWLLLVLLGLLGLGLSGCGITNMIGKLLGTDSQGPEKTSNKKEEKKVIAVSLNEEEPNTPLFLLGIEEMAEKEEVEIKIIKKEEAKDKEAFQDAKVLIYQGGEKSLLQNAEKENIPIIALNKLPDSVKVEGVILPDPDQIGNILGQQIQGAIVEGEGQVVYLQGEVEDPLAISVLANLKQALANMKLNIHSITNPPQSEDIAIQALLEHLQKNSGEVKIICAYNEELAAGASEILKSLQLEDKILLIGMQANSHSLQRIATGSQIGDIDTAPYVQGVNAFQWAKKVLNKESLDIMETITGEQGEVVAKYIPVKSVTTENLLLVQNSYSKGEEAQKKREEEKVKEESGQKKEEKKDKEKKENGNRDSQGEGSKGGDSGDGGNSGGGEGGTGGGQPLAMPQGVSKVIEKVQTEITREYLDEEGKVLGTEKSTNNQVRTIPSEMLLQEHQQQQQGQQGQSDQQGQEEEGGTDSK
ncbi:MAG: substrate-binding domain-containing protein [Desulfitobacterium sp.]|nr:substrate-binding domain-containing protein [Desulfitobacterium sp.]